MKGSTMRQFKRIIVGIVLAVAVAWSLYDWAFLDRGPAYFAADWRRVLLLAVISVAGGLATLVFQRLPALARQHLTTASFGCGVVLVTGCCGYAVWQFLRLRSHLTDSGMFWPVALTVVVR